MPYFSKEAARLMAVRQQKNKPSGAATTRYSSELPEALQVKSAVRELPRESFSEDVSEMKEVTRGTSAGLIRTTLVIFALFLFSVRYTGLCLPTYIEDIFMSAYDYFAPKYRSVYAASDEIGGADEARNTVTEGEVTEYSTVSAFQSATKSHLQEALLARNNGKADEGEVTVSVNQEIKGTFEVENAEKGGIVGKNLSKGTDRIYSTNETNLSPNLDLLAVSAYPIEKVSATEESPQVLIIHTHGTECYSDSKSGEVRSSDRSENVVRVGKELSDILNFYGIPTLHSEEMHDEVSYLTAYSNSKKEVMRLLELHPTIKYVIDLHRDALPNEGSSRVKTSTTINGEETAQVMLVIGTNAGGGNHPTYEQNLTVATHIQSTLNDLYPGLARPINIRNAIFNQNLLPGYILLEVGSDGNTLEEAINAVQMFGGAFARTVKEGEFRN